MVPGKISPVSEPRSPEERTLGTCQDTSVVQMPFGESSLDSGLTFPFGDWEYRLLHAYPNTVVRTCFASVREGWLVSTAVQTTRVARPPYVRIPSLAPERTLQPTHVPGPTSFLAALPQAPGDTPHQQSLPPLHGMSAQAVSVLPAVLTARTPRLPVVLTTPTHPVGWIARKCPPADSTLAALAPRCAARSVCTTLIRSSVPTRRQ